MTQTVYLKLSQITQVHEKNVPLASLGEVYCSEKSVESRCRAMIVKRIRGGGKQRESRLVGNVMEIIQQIEREIPGTSVQNLGETDYVIHYQPPRRQALVWQWCKTLFVCLICFFGAAFAIMTFNNDANVLDVFRKIYMKVLIVGSGGREHAIAWSVSKSPKVDKIYCAPGNAGIAELAECVDIGAMEFEKLADFAQEKEIDLTIIGMDDPLVGGVVDVFEARGLKVFGPRKNAAILEGSKAFSKDLMKKYNIPTAAYENFDDPEKALEYLRTEARFPIVLKADGLALGKGVLICQDLKEAEDGVKEIMEDKKFGNAGNTMVIEEFMTGREVSVLSFVDGKTIRTMTSAQDHKRAQDGDQGLNTGGMGTFSPSPFYTEEVDEFCRKYVYQPTVDAMAAEGRPFKGIIFFGLMLTPDGPKVLEYNARFGDPEAQVVLPRMKNDIIEVMEACVNGTLDQIDLQFEDNAAVCVVLASDGYPVKYEKGIPMYGFENFKGKDGYYCFHAGTKLKDGQIVTNGGRVLGITATGKDLKEARKNAYEATEWITFANKYMRHDIGKAIDEA